MTPRNVIYNYCAPRISVAIDVRQGGVNEWSQAILAGATKGSGSEQTILKELDAFSDGIFTARCWNGQEPIVIEAASEVHLGTFVDEHNRMCDIRTLDHLTMLKATQGNRATMDTYILGSQPGTNNISTMDGKRKVIQSYAANAKLNGMATRAFLNVNFITAIERMLSESGLAVTLQGFNDLAESNMRGSALHSQYVGQITGNNTFQQFGGVNNNIQGNAYAFQTGALAPKY